MFKFKVVSFVFAGDYDCFSACFCNTQSTQLVRSMCLDLLRSVDYSYWFSTKGWWSLSLRTRIGTRAGAKWYNIPIWKCWKSYLCGLMSLFHYFGLTVDLDTTNRVYSRRVYWRVKLVFWPTFVTKVSVEHVCGLAWAPVSVLDKINTPLILGSLFMQVLLDWWPRCSNLIIESLKAVVI